MPEIASAKLSIQPELPGSVAVGPGDAEVIYALPENQGVMIAPAQRAATYPKSAAGKPVTHTFPIPPEHYLFEK